MRTATRSDVGRQPELNEDEVLCEPLEDDQCLLAVADGMGGHQAGDVASRTAVIELRGVVTRECTAEELAAETVLGRAITRANEELQTLAADNPNLDGMGTTLVAAVMRDGEAIIANVGDSRAYLVGEAIEQITEDQNLARELVEQGTLSEEEARQSPHRHVLSQALGTGESVEPEFYETTLESQTLLLCSDGLPEEVGDEKIRDIVTEADSLSTAADTLVQTARDNGGSDNVSVVLATLEGDQ